MRSLDFQLLLQDASIWPNEEAFEKDFLAFLGTKGLEGIKVSNNSGRYIIQIVTSKGRDFFKQDEPVKQNPVGAVLDSLVKRGLPRQKGIKVFEDL
jgi:hypothetical protein